VLKITRLATAIHRAAAFVVRISEKRCIMTRNWLWVVLGVVALLGLPGRSSAHHGGMRGGGFPPGFNRRMFDPRFGRFDPRFDQGFFDPRFGQRFFDPRFDQRFFDPRFSSPFFGPRFSGF
jgi:hypothetical protein